MTFLASPSLGSDPVAYAIHSMRYSLHNCRRTSPDYIKKRLRSKKRSAGVTQGRAPWVESQAARQLNQVVTHSPILLFGCVADSLTTANT